MAKMMTSTVMLVLALTYGAFAASGAETCNSNAEKLGLSVKNADALCNSCATLRTDGATGTCQACSKCHACIKVADSIATAMACAPYKSPAQSPAMSPMAKSPMSPRKPGPPKPPAGTPVVTPLTCTQTVMQNLGVSKATADGLCLACPVHLQNECKTCVKAAMTKDAAKACPSTTV